ncbi:MAG: hypothetical protein EOP12_02610 [Pseudomonas sp.]|nr:MAG: hypothetical protein EOP12_02610 [Pseudomonas sp.]
MHRTKAQAKSVQRRTVRATTLFVVFVCVSLLVVDVWLAWRAREQQLRQAVVSNTNLAAAVAQQMDGMVSEVGHLLNSIAFELEMGHMDPQVLSHLQPILKNHADSNQHVHGLFVYDAQGAWLINSQGPSIWPMSANCLRATTLASTVPSTWLRPTLPSWCGVPSLWRVWARKCQTAP